MKRSEVEQLMQKVKHTQSAMNPRPEWVAETRSRVLRHIELTSAAAPSRVVTLNHLWTALSFIMPQRTVYSVVRPAVIFIICFGVGTGGWITTVSASLNSLPGDALYPVKLASEHTQVAVVDALQGKAASTELRLSLVRRRAEEVQKIVNTPTFDQSAKTERVHTAVEQIKTEVQNVHENLVAVQQTNSPQEVVAVAKAIEKSADEIKQNLVDTSVHASSADALVAIEKLQQDAGKAQAATSTPAASVTVVTTTIPVVLPNTATSSASSTGVAERVQHTTSTSAVITSEGTTITIIHTDDPLKDFPERPKNLTPDVVDTPTPITIETWQ